MFDKCAWVVQDRIGIRTTAPSTLSLPVALGSGVLYLHPRPGPSAPHRTVACLHDLTVPELPHKLPMTVEERMEADTGGKRIRAPLRRHACLPT